MRTTFITGNLGADAEVKSHTDGRKYIVFNVAVKVNKDNIEWYRASVWNQKQVESTLPTFLKKGTKVLLVGGVRASIWEKDVDGVKTSTVALDIMVNDLELLTPAGDGGSTRPPVPAPTYYSQPTAGLNAKDAAMMDKNGFAPVPTTDEEDLPF